MFIWYKHWNINIDTTIYRFKQYKLASSTIFISGHAQNVIYYVYFGRATGSQPG